MKALEGPPLHEQNIVNNLFSINTLGTLEGQHSTNMKHNKQRLSTSGFLESPETHRHKQRDTIKESISFNTKILNKQTQVEFQQSQKEYKHRKIQHKRHTRKFIKQT